MKRKNYYHYSISLFIMVQLACFALLGFWIYWYVSNDIIYKNIANLISPDLLPGNRGNELFFSGVVILTFISLGLILIFVRLLREFAVPRVYDSFIANVTHEFSSPLASIQLSLETMKKHTLSDEQRMGFLELATVDTLRLKKLIDSILEISILEEKRDFFEPKVVDANEIVRKTLFQLSRLFRLPEGSLEIQGTPDCRIDIDPEGLNTVLGNLIDNSIKYSWSAVHIKITLTCDRKFFVLLFKDAGIGISYKNRKDVFKKFTRLQDTKSPSVKGTGLGLYWSRVVVKAHGGRISVVNSSEEQGVCFKIELPLYTGKRKYL